MTEARAGDLVGLAFVAVYHGYDYTADIAGEARRNPTFTRGMLLRLDEQLNLLPPLK